MSQSQRAVVVSTALVLLASVLAPSIVRAQGQSQASITGVVRDASGAVLPGVTVEASSPVLIEKVRVAVSDDSGRYRVVELLPGTYTVTYTLPGFSVVRREGIELSGSLTATLDVELRIGSLEETITVTGESPVVDVQSVKQQRTIGRETIDAIPGARTYQNLATLVPGVQTTGSNVGGINGPAPVLIGGHGGSTAEGRINVDGLGVNGSSGGGSLYVTDTQNVSEVTIDITGGLGESEVGGPSINVVPRTGGNVFSGTMFASGANSRMQSDNFSDELAAQGVRVAGKLNKVWDLNGAFGGPISRDRLWFFVTGRYQGSERYIADMFYNLNAGDPTKWTYEPDRSRQAISDGVWEGVATRMTWQVSQRNKLNFFWDEQDMCRNCWGGGSATVSPEAQNGSQAIDWMRAFQVSYTAPLTSRVLIESGFGGTGFAYGAEREGNDRSMVQVVEQAGIIPGITYRSMYWDQIKSSTPRYRGSMSYVTGSHASKFGFDALHAISRRNYQRGEGLRYRFSNGVPNQLTMMLNDFTERAHVRNFALFAQDRWTLNRFTLQGGVRYERAASNSPEQVIGPSRFVPTPIVIPAQDLIPGYHDITFRGGLAMDVTGDGKTSLKINAGRYMDPAQWAGIYIDPNPARTRFGGGVPPQTTRSWADANRDFVPDCDLLNPAGNGECGPTANQGFGGLGNPPATYDPSLLEGWGVRPGNTQFGISVQREIAPRVSVEVGFHQRWFDQLPGLEDLYVVTDNRAVGPSDFQGYSITAPQDARLPGGGGYVIPDLFDVAPTAFGRTDDFITGADNFGDASLYWHGVDTQVTARLRGGLTVQGGTNTGRQVYDRCALIVDNPSRRNCSVKLPFLTDIRGLASYTVPKVDLQASVTFQSRPGPELSANWNVPSATVAQSLGRPLAGGAANVQVDLLNPGQMYGDRITQFDMRFAKLLRFGRTRTNVGIDIYNVLNSNVPLTYVTTYGANWLRPNSILDARFVKLSAQLDF